ncbi:MAG: FKBP-type peptidyl-prolyl cis-trans isomerase [Acidimicrobiia bacterium]|nr:FKBP-type peptidyl-prolyl cis-trans isomerase [Acidimicrobiia bacterium]
MSPVRLLISIAVLAGALTACGGDDPSAVTTVAPDDGEGTTSSSAPDDALQPDITNDGDDVADDGETVRVHYAGTLDDGEEFDSSAGGDPLQFTVGVGMMIPGFDTAVEGMTVGESKTVTIAAAEAYGERVEDAIVEFPIADVPEEFRVEGIQVDLGNGLPATVVEVTDDIVRVDTNHPLAGEALTFAITLVEIVA